MSAPSPPLHGWSHSIELTIAVQPVVDAPLIRSKETTAAQALDPNPVLSRAQHVAHPNSHDTHPTSPSHLVTSIQTHDLRTCQTPDVTTYGPRLAFIISAAVPFSLFAYA